MKDVKLQKIPRLNKSMFLYFVYIKFYYLIYNFMYRFGDLNSKKKYNKNPNRN